MSKEITDSNFEETLKTDKLVVVKFGTSWCKPCEQLKPVIEKLTTDYSENTDIRSLDCDSNPNSSVKYNIRNIPAILFFKNGEVVDKLVGNVSESTIKAKIDTYLS